MSQGFLDEATRQKLEAAAKVRGTTPERLLNEIVDDYFERDEELRALIKEGMDDIEAGRVHTAEEVKEHLNNYATRVKLQDESA